MADGNRIAIPEYEEQIKAIHEGIQALTKRVWSLEEGERNARAARNDLERRLTVLAQEGKTRHLYATDRMADLDRAFGERVAVIEKRLEELENTAARHEQRIEREEGNRFEVDDAQGTGLAELEQRIKTLEGQRGSDLVGFGSRIASLEGWQKGAALQLDHMLETGYTTAGDRADFARRINEIGNRVYHLEQGRHSDLRDTYDRISEVANDIESRLGNIEDELKGRVAGPLGDLANRLHIVEGRENEDRREISAGFANIRDWNKDNRRELIAITDRLGERLERVEEHLATFGEWLETPQEGEAITTEAVTLEASAPFDVDHLATAVADRFLELLYGALEAKYNEVPF